MLRAKKGFTLIELLIVIVIIGILAGIVVGIVGTNAKKKANDTKKKADFHEIQNALEQYFVDNDAYPANQATFETDLVSANLLKEAPAAMALKSGQKVYTYTEGTTSYKLSVELENQNDQGANTETVDGKRYYFVTSKQ